MAQAFALHHGSANHRARVRTPGKYIFMFLFLPVMLVALGAGLWLRDAERRAAFAAVEYRNAVDGGREAYYPLPPFLVDLRADADGRTAFLKLKASVRLDRNKMASSVERIDAVKPAIIERATFFLRELRPEDFDETEDMERVKTEMLRRINLVLAPYDADGVVIEEIVIQ